MSDSTSNTNTPSLISGHAQYAKGYVEEALGNVTGSKGWQESGKSDSEEGIKEMKAASELRESTTQDGNPTTGKIEEVAGKLTGCEGMEKEGKEKMSNN